MSHRPVKSENGWRKRRFSTLQARLAITLLLCLMVPVLLIGGLAYRYEYDSIKSRRIEQVGWVADVRYEALRAWLRAARERGEVLLNRLRDECRYSDAGAAACAKPIIAQFAEINQASRIEWHLDREGDVSVGADAAAFEESAAMPPGQIARISRDKVTGAAMLTLPAEDSSGTTRLLAIYPAQMLQNIFVNSTELGESGETFLADSQGLFVTQPRYASVQGISEPISAFPMRRCLSGVSSQVLALDYRGVPIIHGFRLVPELGGGCIMAHVDQAEAFSSLTILAAWGGATALAFALLACAVAAYLGKRMAKPISMLADMAIALSKGDFSRRVVVDGYAEVSELSRAFNAMAGQLERHIGQAQYRLELAGKVFIACGEAIVVTDGDNRIVSANPAFERITGYTEAEVVGKDPKILGSGRHDTDFYRAMWEEIKQHGSWSGEIWDRRKNGEVYPKLLTINAIANAAGEITNYVGVFSDISERKSAEEQIRSLAFFDSLTKLPNRRLLLDRAAQALPAAARGGWYGAALMLDLDNFKKLNDTQGHEFGDLLLVQVAERLLSCVRETDTVARLGGDEFVVLLENLGEDQESAVVHVGNIGEKILQCLAIPYILRGYEHHGSSSIGATLFNGKNANVDDLIRQADTAMYSAKKAGRNALHFYDATMQSTLEKNVLLESELRKALLNGELRLYYQLQEDEFGHPLGVEVLLRWAHPRDGLVLPARFISLAEETGLIVPIGRWVLEAACAQIAAWKSHPVAAKFTVAVNVSAREFKQADYVDQVREVIERFQIDPAKLKLELTESLVLHDIADAIAKMEQLGTLGVRFSMDDFGTGYSSLSTLKLLPFRQLKIDQSFVRDVNKDPNDAAIIEAILAMGRTLGMEIIAEGVEAEEQKDFLLNHGCHIFQGYLVGRPMALPELEARLALM